MLNGKSKNNNGITLVALVITIIILLILATISIQSLTSTGLFQKANEAKQKTKNAEENQAKMLNEYEDELNKYISGTVKETFKVTTVADAIQYGDVLNKDDNTELHDAYGNKIVVPAGFKITNDATTVDKGIVIEDVTSGATSGSQFVWIPVGKIYTDTEKTDQKIKNIELGRYTFDSSTGEESFYSGSYVEEDTTTTLKNWGNKISKNITNFKNSVSVNEGYYIGRYEARTPTARTAKEDVLTQITERGTDPVYNYVTQLQAANQAQNMYSSNKFTSDLINSYSWDTTITFIQKCANETNYANKHSLNTDSIATKGTNDTINYNKIQDIQCNIFDMASNVREWSTETSYGSSYPCVTRGGSYYNDDYCTNSRGHDITSRGDIHIGFRPILYINI